MAVLDGQTTSFSFNDVLVGKTIRFDILDGVTPDIPHRPLNAAINYSLPGVAQFGQVSVTLYRDTTDPGQIEMESARAASQRRTCVITLSDGSTRTFPGYVKVLPMVGSSNGIGPAIAIIKVAGAVT